MSVLIKGMEMPETCRDCRLSTVIAFDKRPLCDALVQYMSYGEWEAKRLDNCPLVPIPHGRLIDADALIKVLKAKATNPLNQETTPYNWTFAYECLADVVGDMQTIIPAEEGE